MSESGSPGSSPPAPPNDSSPPPEISTGGSTPPPSPPSDLVPPPSPAAPTLSSPPPSSQDSPSPPPLPKTPPPLASSPPPAPSKSISPPPRPPSEGSATPPAPPKDSNSTPPLPPPDNSETPPAPPQDSNRTPPPPPPAPPQESNSSPPPPPAPEVKSPPPASPSKEGSTTPKNPGPAKSPPAPQAIPPNPPKTFNAPPPNPNKSGAPRAPTHSPSLPGVPRSEKSSENIVPPPVNGDSGGGYQGKTMVGMAVAGVAIIALIAAVFFVRRKKKKHEDVYGNSQYFPPSSFSVKSDGYFYGNNPGTGYPHSGPGGGSNRYNSQQQSSGNSFGSQRGYMQSGSGPNSAVLGSSQTHFSYEEMLDITEGFARHNILGEGGFGCVYKGKFPDGKVVAVKQLKTGSGQGDREFKAEVEIISRVHHCHLVSLVGYCIMDPHRLLIYEFVSNKTLEHHLHGRGMPVLEWAKRVKIAIGSAKGLAYLHEDCHPKIIHRDIKTANILLDDDFEAQVADFGLARLNDTTQTHVSTRVMGTFGYLAPEYASSGKLTDRSDVFSFGVVLLELITGRKPVDQNQPLGEESLVEWARPLLLKATETGDFSELIDPRLENHYVENQVFRMIETAAACVRHSAPKRPRMVQVVRALDSDGDNSIDISNGVKVGQSSVYDSNNYSQDMMKFRRMALGFDESSESGMYSGDYSQKESHDASSESESRALNMNRRF